MQRKNHFQRIGPAGPPFREDGPGRNRRKFIFRNGPSVPKHIDFKATVKQPLAAILQ
ncbi:hypothetical protein HMPREF1141_1169 [Clostridium sp. MSTE9]|nr:hypothetical protein HMPREF1141_1169 [Clostridium sp. MSTE9]